MCDLPLDKVLQNKDKENLLEQLIENATKSIGNLIHHSYLHFGENTKELAEMAAFFGHLPLTNISTATSNREHKE